VDLQARTTTPIVLLDNWAGAHAGQWGADDNHFIYPDPARGLVQRDLTTGHDTVLLGPDSWQSGWFAVGPGGSIAFVLRDSDRHSIAVREPDGLTRRILTAAPGDILDVHAWSADGQYIFFASTRGEATGSIYRVPAVGGVAVDMHIRWAPNPNPAAVSPDGRELAVTEVSVEHELRFLPLYFPN
jgi:dipeptidyl aminopeptidase/acylaminoacyl peptidase